MLQIVSLDVFKLRKALARAKVHFYFCDLDTLIWQAPESRNMAPALAAEDAGLTFQQVQLYTFSFLIVALIDGRPAKWRSFNQLLSGLSTPLSS